MYEKTKFEQSLPGTSSIGSKRGLCGVKMTQRLSLFVFPGLLKINFYVLPRPLEESPYPQGHLFLAIVQVRKMCNFGVESTLWGKYLVLSEAHS